MPTASQSRKNGRISAVIRSFHPSRIERELLAQVYDIAQRGIHDHSACVGECPTVVGQVNIGLAAESLQCQIDAYCDGREYSLNLYLNRPLVAFSYRATVQTKKGE